MVVCSIYNYRSKEGDDYRIGCIDSHNAKAYGDVFKRCVSGPLGVLVAGTFVGLAVYRPDVLVGLMNRVVQQVPAVAGEFLKSLDFANSMITQAIGALIGYGAMLPLSKLLCVVIKLIYMIGRKSGLISSDPKLLNTEYIRSGCQKFKTFKEAFNKKNQGEKITEVMFDEVVEGFKTSFDLKSIKNAFSYSINWNKEPWEMSPSTLFFGDFSYVEKDLLLDKFFLDPVISKYLSREKVEYEGNSLVLRSKNEYSLYEGSGEPYYINFRIKIKNKDVCETFYSEGTTLGQSRINFSMERAEVEQLLNRNIYFSFEGDIYEVAAKVREIEFNRKGLDEKAKFSYYVLPGAKDAHGYLTAAIFDAKTGESICAFLVNSWDKKSYFEGLKSRFVENKTCPFIDCSIDVQVNEKDGNCGLYNSILGRALVQLFAEQPEESDKIFEAYRDASQELKGQAEENLQKFIRSSIIKYLPEFYGNENGEFVRKPEAAIKAVHMKRRWVIGNVAVNDIVQQAKRRSAETNSVWFF